jgi:type IV pilus assembly protein PilV
MTTKKANRPLKSAPRRQAGATLIEILVAMLILSLGVLGMGALQTRAIKGNNSSVQRSQAVMLNYALMDAMRLDKASAKGLLYNTGSFVIATGKIDAKICSIAAITGTTLKDNNQLEWLKSLKKNIGTLTDTTSCGAISCDADGNCRVQVFWDDQLSGGLGEQMIETVSRL